DVGSEIVAGVGANVELASNIVFGAEAVGFVPLPSSMAIGTCTLYSGAACSTLEDADYFNGGGAGDLAAYAMAGITYRVNPHVAVNILGGAGLVGDRRDDLRVTGGITWAPQPKDVARIGRGDTDGDGLPDVSDACPEDTEDKDGYQDDDGCPDVDNDGDGVVDANDACPDEPEDRDGFQDDDGCPERDNDNDGITDVADRCPDQAEDKDGFEDDDGCPDEDNDGDGFPDAEDRCPNEAETVNGVDDDDGCPDTRAQTGPEEGTDRINLKGNKIEFSGRSSNLTNASKVILGQVAQLITSRGLAIRIEVHVPLGTTSKNKSTIAKQQKKDKALTDSRAQAIVNELVKAGVPAGSVQGVGLGSTRPFGNSPPTDPLNERVDFIKTQLRSP
ncbi:MAG: OmpA family protein, partial [Myxococcales bacterium]|nr:OmpA family protein [Myxococcales bacterium]